MTSQIAEVRGDQLGTSIPFKPVHETDWMNLSNSDDFQNTRFQSITFMTEYESKSFEELRLEDYQLGRRNRPNPTMSSMPSQTSTFVGLEQASFTFSASSGSLFGQTDQNRQSPSVTRQVATPKKKLGVSIPTQSGQDNKGNLNVLINEHLTCPICLELPEDEIYQCQNGHSVCKKCCQTMSVCSICRVPYGSQKVRNRAMETLLENTEAQCKYRNGGCLAVSLRKEMLEHLKQCKFRPVEFCKSLGLYPFCQFASSAGQLVMDHLLNSHEAVIVGDGEEICIEKFGKFVKTTGELDTYHPKIWILYKFALAPIVICLFVHKNFQGVSFLGLNLGSYSNSPQIGQGCSLKFTIFDKSDKMELMNWTNKISDFTVMSESIKKSPFRVDINYLNDALQGENKDYDLVWKVERMNKLNSTKIDDSVKDLIKECKILSISVDDKKTDNKIA